MTTQRRSMKMMGALAMAGALLMTACAGGGPGGISPGDVTCGAFNQMSESQQKETSKNYYASIGEATDEISLTFGHLAIVMFCAFVPEGTQLKEMNES